MTTFTDIDTSLERGPSLPSFILKIPRFLLSCPLPWIQCSFVSTCIWLKGIFFGSKKRVSSSHQQQFHSRQRRERERKREVLRQERKYAHSCHLLIQTLTRKRKGIRNGKRDTKEKRTGCKSFSLRFTSKDSLSLRFPAFLLLLLLFLDSQLQERTKRYMGLHGMQETTRETHTGNKYNDKHLRDCNLILRFNSCQWRKGCRRNCRLKHRQIQCKVSLEKNRRISLLFFLLNEKDTHHPSFILPLNSSSKRYYGQQQMKREGITSSLLCFLPLLSFPNLPVHSKSLRLKLTMKFNL